MTILKLRASFGKLEGETLSLHEGLNVVHAPNESGKSTWCAFIRAMLYGVDSSERAKNGYLPDKLRYAPWSGAPMEGSMDLRCDGSDITITRRTRSKLAPMREFSAVYTGSAVPVEELDAQNAGQMLTGVSRDVFTRSAFIGQGAVAVSGSAELEKRINAIVSTGDERGSYSEADEQLRAWQRKRRYHRKGGLPALEARMDETRARLEALQNAGGSMEALELRLAACQQDCRRLEAEMAESRRKQRKEALEKLNRGKQLLQQSSERHDAALAALSQSREALSENVFGAHRAEEAERMHEEDRARMRALTAESKRRTPLWPALLCFALSLVFVALFSAFTSKWLLLPAALCLAAAVTLLLRAMSARRRTEYVLGELRQLLRRYRVQNESELQAIWDDYQSRLAALHVAEREELESRAAYERTREAQQQFENEALESLDFSGGSSEAARIGRALNAARQEAETLSARIAALGGKLSVLGDPLVLTSELRQLQDSYDELQTEYDALTLAIDTLRQADAELQSRFSPALGRVAAGYMSKLTGGRYTDVLIDRDFSARARVEGDTVAHEAEYLSAGTLDLLYLAVRLAVCELALPEGEPCPLILDDALVNLDETRQKQAMGLLREIAKKRQVILFTCRKAE